MEEFLGFVKAEFATGDTLAELFLMALRFWDKRRKYGMSEIWWRVKTREADADEFKLEFENYIQKQYMFTAMLIA